MYVCILYLCMYVAIYVSISYTPVLVQYPCYHLHKFEAKLRPWVIKYKRFGHNCLVSHRPVYMIFDG